VRPEIAAVDGYWQCQSPRNIKTQISISPVLPMCRRFREVK
jgi:hypothetical protein